MTFRGKKKRFIDAAVYIGLTVFAVFYSLPFISMIGTALKGDSEALSNSALFPKHLVWDSFRKVLEGRFIMTTVNSMKISLHLIDTHLSLILSYTCLNLPFSVWLMKGFFDTVPYELEESAYIDGCGKFGTLMRIVIPVSLPGIATAGIFTFLNVWNEYTFSNTFVKNPDLVTLTVGLQDYLSQNSNSWGQMMAASTIGIIPSVLFLLFAQKYLIQGMTAGAVKG